MLGLFFPLSSGDWHFTHNITSLTPYSRTVSCLCLIQLIILLYEFSSFHFTSQNFPDGPPYTVSRNSALFGYSRVIPFFLFIIRKDLVNKWTSFSETDALLYFLPLFLWWITGSDNRPICKTTSHILQLWRTLCYIWQFHSSWWEMFFYNTWRISLCTCKKGILREMRWFIFWKYMWCCFLWSKFTCKRIIWQNMIWCILLWRCNFQNSILLEMLWCIFWWRCSYWHWIWRVMGWWLLLRFWWYLFSKLSFEQKIF